MKKIVCHISKTCSYFNIVRMYDNMIDFNNNMVFMFKVNTNLLPNYAQLL